MDFKGLLSSFKKKLLDNEGVFQQGRFTPLQAIPQVKQANQAIVNNVVKPIGQSIYNSAQPIINYVNPQGYQAERQSLAQGGNLGNQKFFNAAKAVPPTAGKLFGASRMGVSMPLISGAIGGVVNKATGGSFQQGFQSGIGASPTIAGIGAFSNPLITQSANRFSGVVNNPIGKQVINRIASGIGNIPEGYLMNKGLGQSYSPKQAAFDFATGAVLQGPQSGKIQVKGARKTIDPQTLDEVDILRDTFNRAIKGESFDLRQASRDVDNIASKWLDKAEIASISAKSKGKQPSVYYRNLLDTIAKKVGDYNSRYEGFQMGITGKQDISPDRAAVEQNLNPTQKNLGRAMLGSTQEDMAKKAGVTFKVNDVLNKAKQEIGRKDNKIATVKDKFNEFYTDWVNKFHPVESLTSSIEKATGKVIDTVNNPKYAIKRLLGAGGTAELRHKRTLEPIINQLGNVDRSDFDVFMKAQRDIELSQRGIKGSSESLAKERIAALGQKYDIPQLERVANQLYTYQREGLNKLKQAGFLSEQAIQAITSQNQKYVPFQRISDELDNYLGVPSSKLQQASTPIQKIKGSDKAIESPLESVIANTYKIEAAVAKNNVAKSIVGLSKVAPEYKTLFQRVEKSDANTIAVWNNGKKEFYKAPDEIVKVVKGLNEENTNALVSILSIPAKFFRQQTTGRNPAFFIPNMVRDQFDAAINAKYGYVPFFDYMRGLTHLIKDKYGGGDELVQQWMKSGGAMSFDAMGGRETIRKQIQDATQEKKLVQKALDMFIGGIDTIGEFSEVPTRLGVFKRALDKTGNADIAAYESREATMDFSRMGAKMKTANSLIPFLNVGVQGFDKMIRVAKDNPAKLGMAMAGYALFPQTMVSVYNNLFHGEDYAQVPDFEKEGNFILLTGQKDREGMPIYAKIPKGHTQQLLTAPMDNLITYLYSNNPQSFQQMALSMLSGALPVIGDGSNLSDIGSRTLGENLPQAVKPLAETVMNRDTFRNKSIVDPYTEKLPPAAQFYASTPEEYKKLGGQLNMSPAKLQYLSEGYGGGLSKEVGNLKSTAQDALAGNPLDINKIPLARRFVGSYSGFDTDRPQAQTKEEVNKAVQDRQVKLELKNSNETSRKVGNTLYIKRTDKNGKVSIDTQELPSGTQDKTGIQKQGFMDSFIKPAPKFVPKEQPKTSAEKKAELDAVKTEFKLSEEKVKKYGNYVLIKNGDSVKTIQTDKKVEEPKLTGNTTLDKKLISQYKTDLTNKANDIVDLFQAGVLTKDEAEKKLQTLNSLSKSASAKTGSGGKKKIKIAKLKLPKAPRITAIKLAPVKIKSPKIKVKKTKVKKFKITSYKRSN